MTTLYKVTKIRLRYDKDKETYVEDRRKVDYRAHKGAVTLAFKYANEQNAAAERFAEKYPRSYGYTRYKVEVEVAELPVFKPAGWCEKHGVQEFFNVPGLTTEPTCMMCI